MADEVKWWIDPDSGKLMYPADQYYTAREFASQIGPPCPVCGRRVVVERIAAPQFGAPQLQLYILRGWRCPRGCAKGWAERSQT